MPTFGSLFAGIGGIDLGLERAGWTGRWQVEYEPFCQRVLAKHWPDVTRYGDIHDVDWSTVERVDLVAGGFPCQPVSSAGRQTAQDDARWLWPEFARCVRDLRPRYVLVENVTNLLGINGGSAFGDVLGDLATLGYDSEWDCIPAAAVGAPHLRDRIWIVAYADGIGQGWSAPMGSSGLAGIRQGQARSELDGPNHGAVAHADESGLEGELFTGVSGEETTSLVAGRGAFVADSGSKRSPRSGEPLDAGCATTPSNREAVGPLDGRLAHQWSVEPDVGRVAHGVPNRVDRLRSLGNAVVPQVVEFIGRRILEAEALT